MAKRKKLSKRARKKKLRVRRLRVAVAGALVLALAAGLTILLTRPQRDAEVVADTAQPTPELTASPVSTPIPTPTVAPTPKGLRVAGTPVPSAAPENPHYRVQQRVYISGNEVDSYAREDEIHMGGADEYTDIEGVLTFRGDHYRGNAAYGEIPDAPSALDVVWTVKVGRIDDWSGVGWTGQPAIVKWPEDMRGAMNIVSEKRAKTGLVEVIAAALDGKIRFLDLEDGEQTRKPIDIGAPIKGSVSVDPRGVPLLYCGQGIDEVNGRSVKIGTRIFSLIDQKTLFFLDGKDKYRTRNWYAFDASPLIDGATDTLLQLGENGLLYTIDLNTQYDAAAGTIAVNPTVDRYAYKSEVTTRPGMENSIAVYNQYGYFADNSGLLQCVDLNTLKSVWVNDVGDDTDATCAIEEEPGRVALYTANELDLRGNSGKCSMRKLDALSGEELWNFQVSVTAKSGTNGGAFASPAVGQRELSELTYFNVARTKEGGTLFAVEKATGALRWSRGIGSYGWSSPVLVYTKAGAGYVVQGNSKGALRLIDGLSGQVIAETKLGTNIEGSPAVYGDMIVVGTRGGRIHGVRIS